MRFVGQQQLCDKLQAAVENGFSPFSIIVGPRGGGKKTIARMVANYLHAIPVERESSIADVRAAIESSYKVKAKTLYIFGDADKMSNEAKSALLKITEEPPNNSYFIMTLENYASVPSTIASRAAVYWLDSYSKKELEQCATDFGRPQVVSNFCDTPGDVQILAAEEIDPFLEYVELVLDNIAEVGVPNSLKIGSKISLKDKDDTGYDLKLFWKAFIYQCMQRAEKELPKKQAFDYAAGALLTGKYVSELNIRGVNKNMLFLDWVLQIRKEWSW